MGLPIARQFSSAQLDTIKRTCAKDTDNIEFNYFIAVANALGLDPLRRQIMANVYNKNNKAKRNVVVIVEIGGLRSIAARSGRYRPDDKPPAYVYDQGLVSDTNPKGIESCSVGAWYFDDNQVWQRVDGTVYWDEFAAIEDDWEWHPEIRGKKVFSGEQTLSNTWKKMGRHMIAKCAEAHALRKGWPEELSGVYEHSEASNFDDDMLPSDVVDLEQVKTRVERVGLQGDQITIQWESDGQLVGVPTGEFYDRVAEWVGKQESVMELLGFQQRNEISLKTYWTKEPGGAHELKLVFEARKKLLEAGAELVAEEVSA